MWQEYVKFFCHYIDPTIKSDDNDNTATIAGAIAGVIVVIGGIAVLIIGAALLYRYRKRKEYSFVML